MKHLKRWQTVRIILLFAVIGLPVIAWVVADQMASAAVRREVRALEAKGQSLSWDVLAPPRPPDEENAGLIYERAFPLLSETASDTEQLLFCWVGKDPPWDEKARQNLVNNANVNENVKASAITEEMYWEVARQRLGRNKQALDLIEQAAAMEECWFPVNYEAGINATMPHLHRLRDSARLLSLRARLARHDGDLPGAYEDIRMTLRVERGLRQPMLISNAVSVLIVRLSLNDLKDTLAEDDANPEAWRRLLEELSPLHRKAALANAVQGERAMSTGIFDLGPSAVAAVTGRQAKWYEHVWSVLGRPIMKYNMAHYLRSMTDLVEAVRKEPPEAIREVEAVQASLNDQSKSSIFARLLAPSLTRAYMSHVECEADQALARVALGLKLYKNAHGEYPESLDALAPDPFKEVPKDPFSGKALVYQRTGTGFVLYSVGLDREDNAGNETPPDERDRDQGVDIVWKAEK